MIENNITRYREYIAYCNECHGVGRKNVNDFKSWFKRYIKKNYEGEKNIVHNALKDYRIFSKQWNDDFTVPCTKCFGEGSWTVRI